MDQITKASLIFYLGDQFFRSVFTKIMTCLIVKYKNEQSQNNSFGGGSLPSPRLLSIEKSQELEKTSKGNQLLQTKIFFFLRQKSFFKTKSSFCVVIKQHNRVRRKFIAFKLSPLLLLLLLLGLTFFRGITFQR